MSVIAGYVFRIPGVPGEERYFFYPEKNHPNAFNRSVDFTDRMQVVLFEHPVAGEEVEEVFVSDQRKELYTGEELYTALNGSDACTKKIYLQLHIHDENMPHFVLSKNNTEPARVILYLNDTEPTVGVTSTGAQ